MSITITRYRGDTVPDVFTVKDASGSAVNITGATFVMTVDSRQSPTDDTTKLFDLTGTIVNASAGQVSFSPSSMEANQTPGKYYFDIQMTDSGGFVQTLVKGVYTFVQDITK